jgi:hypothetical protein
LQARNQFLAACLVAGITGHRLRFSAAFRVDPVGRYAFVDQIISYRFGTALRQSLIVSRSADAVGMANDSNGFDFGAAKAGDQFIKLGFLICADRVFVETEKRLRLEIDAD